MSAPETPSRPDLAAPEVLADPHRAHRVAFEPGAVCPAPDPRSRTVFVGRHAEVCQLLRDPRLSSDRIGFLAHRLSPPQQQAIDALLRSMRHWLLFKDPPAHTKLRRAINAALSRRLMLQMQPDIERLVAQLLDRMLAEPRFDVVADLAAPLPALVIAQMLGAEAEDFDALKAWSDDIAHFLGNRPQPAEALKAQGSVVAMTEYFARVLARHRARPRDDLLGALLAVQAETPGFDDDALLANCVGLMFAGHETTTNLIGNAVHLLLDRPAVMEQLRADPAAWDGAVEEALRYESPVQRASRVTLAPVDVGEVTIPVGQRIVLVLGAANRDPRVFEEPDCFDIHRAPNPHVAFGFGIHACSGASLARLEAHITLRTLFERVGGLHREEPVRWKPNFGLRSLESLVVSASTA